MVDARDVDAARLDHVIPPKRLGVLPGPDTNVRYCKPKIIGNRFPARPCDLSEGEIAGQGRAVTIGELAYLLLGALLGIGVSFLVVGVFGVLRERGNSRDSRGL